MDAARLNQALAGFRKTLRLALKAKGLNREVGKLIAPPEGADLFEGLDATPAELVAILDHKAYKSSQMLSTLTRMASVGFAVEMGMHEVNTEMSSAISSIKAVAANPERAGKQLDYAIGALQRLSGSLSVFSTMQNDRSAWATTGADVLKTVQSIYGHHYLEREKITIEATKAFLNAGITGPVKNTLPPLLNLVRNAIYWTSKSDRPRHIKLDAETVPMEVRDFDSDDETATKIEDAIVLSVSDSGPGVPPELAETVFMPFVSGRGSTGIGLYLTREHLERNSQTVVLSPEPSELGGAEFRVGPRKLLDPVPREPLDDRRVLVAAGRGIVEMLEDGRRDDVLRQHSDLHAELMQEALRIRIEGPADAVDQEILDAAFAVDEALLAFGRARPSARASTDELETGLPMR